MALHNIKFPSSVKVGNFTLKYDSSYVREFNNNLNLTQKHLDNLVIDALQKYVSYKDGYQEASIRNSSVAGSGYVKINVPYAEYQAYSKRIKKRVGKRGTQPFERMKSDNKDNILRQLEAYSRRINGQ